MTTQELKEHLNYVNHSREQRQKYAKMVLENTKLLYQVLDIAFEVDSKISPRACWLFEFVARENIYAILPFVSRFSEGIHTIHQDPAVRPMAKVCEYLIEAKCKQKDEQIIKALTTKHIDAIIEFCFDCLITDQKVAPKAYSMNVLYLLGREHDWIHKELGIILIRDIEFQSAAFKARAKQILRKIKVN